jgi:predicted metal-dependent peptidase
MKAKKWSRAIIDETIANGFSSPLYKGEYEFWFHVLAQCKVILTDDVDLAGVNFKSTKYCLYINPEKFDELPLNQRLGVLKHEMMHILYNHLSRKELRQHKPWNVACDCAINQQIKSEDLPDGCITPKSLEKALKDNGHNITVPRNENSETYYDLLPEDDGDGKDGEDGDGGECSNPGEDGEACGECDECKNSKNGKGFYDGLWEDVPTDNHEKWEESEGDEDLKRDITKKMVEKAIDKSRGNTPSIIGELLDIWTKKPVVSWKKVLRNIASNKKARKIPTIMKKSRRFPNRPDIKGNKKDREFDIVVVLDVSGSMSDDEIIAGLVEIKEVARLTSSTIKIIQIDTEVHSVDDFDPKSRTFKRNAGGGTEMLPAWKYIKENKIPMDCAILISDMCIENLHNWDNKGVAPKCKTIFLATDGYLPNEIDQYKNYIGFDIKDA